MSTWNELKQTADKASAALDGAREEIESARGMVERALADINTAVRTRVDTRVADVPVPLDQLTAALAALKNVETKYALPPKTSPGQ